MTKENPMDVDNFITGEIKGAEALHFLNTAYAGQKCSVTVHAHEATEALKKLTDYAMYGSKYRIKNSSGQSAELIARLKAKLIAATMDKYYMSVKLLSADEITDIIDDFLNSEGLK